MQFELPFATFKPGAAGSHLQVGPRQVPLRFVPNRRARRYVLRLSPAGEARVTVPRGGSYSEAWRFAEKNRPWLEKQLLERARKRAEVREWRPGTEILFRGQLTRLEATKDGLGEATRLGNEIIAINNPGTDLRADVERHLRALAEIELPVRVRELATLHAIPLTRVSVRNQRSRWGSCSRRGTISLNWRLVQAPQEVRDYIVLHELAHTREMNHSPRFWREVERLCPGFRKAEAWLRSHACLLR